MRATPTELPEVLLLEPVVHIDARGFLFESFSQRTFEAATGQRVTFMQDNHSRSARGVLRGLHYQLPPHAQGKLVRVASGRVFDVAVDMRRSSPRFGQWVGTELSAENRRQLWIPPGFAHGLLVLSDSADVLYKTTRYYDAASERSVRWDDGAIGIAWPCVGDAPTLSAKDAIAGRLEEAPPFD